MSKDHRGKHHEASGVSANCYLANMLLVKYFNKITLAIRNLQLLIIGDNSHSHQWATFVVCQM